MKNIDGNVRHDRGDISGEWNEGPHTAYRGIAILALEEHLEVVRRFATEHAASIEATGRVIAGCFREGGKLLVCGNGGSAADAQHMVAELVGRFARERAPLPALALTVNTSILTALGNDYGYEEIFVRQLRALGRPGDILLGISTSGRSRNVVEALKEARRLGLKTISLAGDSPGLMGEHSDFVITVPAKVTARIQEVHITIIHILCEIIERELFPDGRQ